MVNKTGRRTPYDDDSAQGRQGQFLVQAIAGSPDDDSSGEQVDHDGKVQPALSRPDVGDVRTSLPVRTGRRKVLVQEVRRDRKGMQAVGGALEPSLLPRLHTVLAHQEGNAPAPDP